MFILDIHDEHHDEFLFGVKHNREIHPKWKDVCSLMGMRHKMHQVGGLVYKKHPNRQISSESVKAQIPP